MRKILLTILTVFIGLTVYAADYSSFKLDNGQNVVLSILPESGQRTFDEAHRK